jgi:hypothetical protein
MRIKHFLTELNSEYQDVMISLRETLEDFNYADGISLLSHNQARMQNKLNNFSKTEELRVNIKSQHSIMLANKAIRRVHVHDFTYLGSNVSEDGGTCKDV